MNDSTPQPIPTPQPTDAPQLVGVPQPIRRSQYPPILFGTLCILIGLILGGAGIFAVTQVFNKPSCPDCECPSESSTPATNNNLTTGFFNLEKSGENIIYSPLSIKNGLSLLNAGAAGETKTEIENILGDAELPKYQNVPNVLSVANGVFIRDSFSNKVLSSYSDTVSQKYQADLIYDSFAGTNTLDNWIKDKTFNLIDKSGAQLTPDTEMVLANALAIQMNWKSRFSDNKTGGRKFYKNDDSEITATTMHQKTNEEDVTYYTDDDITMLKMPLEPTDDASLEFVAVMPSGNLTDYVNNLNISDIEEKLANSTSASATEEGIEIYIPKFKFEYSLDFVNDLKKLGIEKAFNRNVADFSNMASDPLYLSDAIHTANIDFSEEGVKAAAITVFIMDAVTAMPREEEPVIINIDHPFFFMIRDKNNGAIWFTGAVYQPNLWENDSAEYQARN